MSADERAYSIEPIGSWVAPVPAFSQSLSVSTTDAGHGYHDQLSDLQINGVERGNTRVFSAVEYSLTNQVGVENFSNIEISFDPTYQRLSLHELIIKREGRQINRLDTAQVDVSHSEGNSAKGVYDATQTVILVLNDLQAGDTIRYSYTLTGDNPLYGGYREFHVNTELWTQLDRQYFRLLTASDDPLSRRIRGAEVSLAVKDKLGVQETILDQLGVAEFETETGVPSWHAAQGAIVFSDMDSWQAVVEWAMPLYQLPATTHTDVRKIADAIKLSSKDRDGQIGKALKWVQENISDNGIELSAHSQFPSMPETTLMRKFGDAKDKARLLMAILKELDVEAHAAMVNTKRGLEAADYPFRLHAFNHVVVHVRSNGESHFIDPSRRGQSGSLGELYEPNYGRALILAPETVALTAMNDSLSIVQQSVYKELTLPDEWSELLRTSMADGVENSGRAAGLKVTSQKQGLLAEQIRENIEFAGEGYLNETYLDYYQVLFPKISSFEAVALKESENNNATFVESYTIDEFWNIDEKVGEHRWLYADEIIAYLDLPMKIQNRQQPYQLLHPVSITETWKVPVSPNVRMLLEEASIENDWVSFSKTVAIDEEKKQATITFVYSTLSNEVAARDIDLYVESVEAINDQASFYLQNSPGLAAAAPVELPWNTAKVKFWVIFLAMLYFIGWSLHFMKKYRKTIDYHSNEYTGH